MTIANFRYANGQHYIRIIGHADYAPPGTPDIVCSACSTLACTLLNCLMAEESAHGLTLEHSSEPGNVRIVAKPTGKAQNRVTQIINTIQSGYALLAQQYPQNVSLLVQQ